MECENFDEMDSKCDGGFAEYCALPARCFVKIGDDVTLEEAALVEPLANAVATVNSVNIKYMEKVVVIGPGPIGLMAAQIASLYSPSVLALVGTRNERLALGFEYCNVTNTVNIKNPDELQHLKNAVLCGKGADVVIDTSSLIVSSERTNQIIGWTVNND